MDSAQIRFLRRVAAALAMLGAVAGASPAIAQVDPNDGDADGVADVDDQCPDTPTDDLIDSGGCSVCPCEAPDDDTEWTSHVDYVRCLNGEVKDRHRAGTMKRREMLAAVKRARRSTCGNPNLTRCCVYNHLDDSADVNLGQCRMMRPDDCDALFDQVDWAEDIGGGSCTPNPCQF